MPVRREQVAAALKYLGDKADVKRRYERLTSLDQPQDSDAIDMALEMGGSLVPGVGPALAARDFERARRADDPAGMAMAGASALPLGKLVGALRGYDPVMREIDVYHGSPHRFEEFDASKIGTGEGAQAYGHGIYLAESPKVAKDYQTATSKGQFLTDKGNFDPRGLEHLNVRVKAWNGDLEGAIAAAKKYSAPRGDYPEAAEKAARDLRKLEELKASGNVQSNPGNFYTADLPDEMVDRMLDWDKPLSEQPEAVRRALTTGRGKLSEETLKSVEQLYGSSQSGNQFGAGFFKFLQSEYPSIKSQKDVSEWLQKRGIPGIRYLDAGSRGQGGTGTRNFVVFPGEEKKVKILKRE